MTTERERAETETVEALQRAAREAVPIEPVRQTLGDDLEAAYRVQAALVSRLAGPQGRRVGRKVGLTSPAVQQQLGVDQPDFGVLLDSMHIENGGDIDLTKLVAPRIEAEVAFVLAHDVVDVSRDGVISAVDYAVAALEIVDSRIRDWDISIVDTVSDNASSARFVVGDVHLDLAEFEPRLVDMTLDVNGSTVSTGNGVACLGDPINALVWVAETAARLGDPLQAGEIVLSGALGPMVPLRPGDRVSAQIGPLGLVSTTAGKAADHV